MGDKKLIVYIPHFHSPYGPVNKDNFRDYSPTQPPVGVPSLTGETTKRTCQRARAQNTHRGHVGDITVEANISSSAHKYRGRSAFGVTIDE